MPRKRRWPFVALAVAGCCLVLFGLARLFGDQDEDPVQVPDCQQGPTVPGIDVSYYQESINWRHVRRAGVLFAFIRVSDGSTIDDPLFTKNWAGAKRAGVMRGAYQYFRPDQSATAQADLLIAALRSDRGELPPVIDVETTGGKSATQIAKAVAIWVARIRDKLHVEPIVYSGPDFWRDRVGGADLAHRVPSACGVSRPCFAGREPDHRASVASPPLWIAHYTSQCPTVPAPWKAWTFWQYSDRGAVPGINGAVDLDLFAGTFEDLEDFARRARL